jgi:hypothetical protein
VVQKCPLSVPICPSVFLLPVMVLATTIVAHTRPVVQEGGSIPLASVLLGHFVLVPFQPQEMRKARCFTCNNCHAIRRHGARAKWTFPIKASNSLSSF